MILMRVICVLIGYAFGLIQTAYIIGRFKGIDIRNYGSGNAGTTNTLRVLGAKAGLIVFAGDMLKSIVAVCLVRFIIGPMYPGYLPLLLIYTGFGAVLGHNFPFYLDFKGGKGIAATGGMMIAFHWSFVPIGLLLFFGNYFLTHLVSLGSLLLYFGFFVQLIVLGQIGVWDVSQSALIETYFIAFLMTVLAFWKHRANIGRLLRKEERKTYILKKDKERLE